MIKKILGLFALSTLVLSVFCFKPIIINAQDVNDFIIESFDADYYINKEADKTSTLSVNETIIVNFNNLNQNHGILRAIPKTYQRHSVSLSIVSVTDENNSPHKYTTESKNDNTILKIGDPNRYVQGLVTYKINYKLRNVINFQDTADELYWDVNGDQWKQSIKTVTAQIHIPQELSKNLINNKKCFVGNYGNNHESCSIDITPNDNAGEVLVQSSAISLSPKQTLTFVIGFDKGTFVMSKEVIKEQKRNQLIKTFTVIACSLIPAITLFILIRRWKKYGDDPSGKGIIIPEYTPPKNFNILESSFILSESVTPKAISASIIELAISGYIRILETKKKKLFKSNTEYSLELTKDTAYLPEEQKAVLNALFGENLKLNDTVNLNEEKSKLYMVVKSISKQLSGKMLRAGYFLTDTKKIIEQYLKIGIPIMLLGIFMAFTLKSFYPILWLGVSIAVSGLIVTLFSNIMPAKTVLGVTTKDHLLGLKEYIKLAEADRIKYLQSPAGAEKISIDPNNPSQMIKLFETLLPYAMIFGMEKKWAKQFESLYSEPPNWYRGNWGAFSAIHLTNSISDMSSVSSAAFSAPSSSGGSGLGGGGFSGGGGGGGGGGGW